MIKLVMLVSFMLVSFNAGAADNNETKPLDMPDFSKVHSSPESKQGIKLQASCRTSTGRTLTKSEPGYESCMSAAQIELSKKHGTSVGPQTGPAAGVNFEVGH